MAKNWYWIVFGGFCTAALAAAIWAGSASAAPTAEQQRASIRGLAGLRVVVENHSTVEREGLSAAQITSLVERWLEQSGIPVLTKEAWAEQPGRPFLRVKVDAAQRPAGNNHAIMMNVSLMQDMRLARDSEQVISCATWSSERCEIIVRGGISSTVQSRLNNIVFDFIFAYLAENSAK